MPTPVSAARQCLAGEAAAALDEAVAVARRRAHAQTTSLHVVFALLSLPTSPSSVLRDALSRGPSAAFSPLLQLKALELSFSMALDRLPSAASGSSSNKAQRAQVEPPVSNSLMAAIKRSQANQRRNPDNFYLYQQQQQQQQQSSSSAGVKVELQHLVLSILDDPVVSRVFGEAGFRSYDIKLAILRPPPSISRFPRTGRCPPLFLCNFPSADDLEPTSSRSFPFPFSSESLYSDGAEENSRRIAEVLVRQKGRNPLLVGVGARDAALEFESTIGRQNWASFPPEARGVVCFGIENEVAEFVSGGRGRPWLDSRLSEIALLLAAESSPGVILCFGDLKRLVDVVGGHTDGDGPGRVSYVVSELTRVLRSQPKRLWLMGSAATYETYMKFLSVYPSVDKDWDLQLLPITSVKPGSGGFLPRPNSLKESFVPFGGFVTSSSDSVPSLSREPQSPVPCTLCSEQFDQELAALLKDFAAPVGADYQISSPPCQQQTELTSINSGLDMEKARGDGTILNAKVLDLQKKWNDICQCQHQSSQKTATGSFRVRSGTFSHANALQNSINKEGSSNQADRDIATPPRQNTQGNRFHVVVSLQKISTANQGICTPIISEVKNENSLSNLQVRPSNSEELLGAPDDRLQSHSGGISLLSTPDSLTSPLSVTSVSTNLMLGTAHTSIPMAEKSMLHPHTKPLHDLHDCLGSKKIDAADGNVSVSPIQYSSCLVCSDSLGDNTDLPVQTASYPYVVGDGASASDKRSLRPLSGVCKPFGIQDLKRFCKALTERVGWQEDAIRAISQTIVHWKAGNKRLHGARVKGDIWFSFLGPDRIGKRKIASTLAELLLGSGEKLIHADLNLQDGLMHSNRICNIQDINGYEVNDRGKTVVDYIAGEIRKKPWSVVLLENVDKADLLMQNSLSQAIKTGRFTDSHRREIGINNAVFVTTAGAIRSETDFSSKACIKFSEERILAVQACRMKIMVDSASDTASTILCVNVSGMSSNVFACKRKLNMVDGGEGEYERICTSKHAKKASNALLDLNLPVEDLDSNDTDYNSNESNCMTENMEEAWMEEFLDAVDETVVFKPFDFDALADDILKEINRSIQNIVGSNCVLEIDRKVMEQILAAVWVSESKGAISKWIQQVLVRSVIEAREVHILSPKKVLRLLACDDDFVQDFVPGFYDSCHQLISHGK